MDVSSPSSLIGTFEISQGSIEELEKVQLNASNEIDPIRRHIDQIGKHIDQIRRHNLTTNDPHVLIINYTIRASHPSEWLNKAMKETAALVGEVVMWILLFGFLAIIFLRIIHETLLDNIADNIAHILSSIPSNVKLPLSACTLILLILDHLRRSYKKEKEIHSHTLTYTIQPADTSFPHNVEMANQSSEQFVDDVISSEGMKREWVNAPRFIKLGQYVIPVQSLLPVLFINALRNNGIVHPLEPGRLLKEVEQNKLLSDLSRLFAINEKALIQFWDPFSEDEKKWLNNDHRILGTPEADRSKVMEDLLFEEWLSKRIKDWSRLSRADQCVIKDQLRKDVFASLRLMRFLNYFESFRFIPLKNSKEDSSTLGDLLSREKAKKFSYRKPVPTAAEANPLGLFIDPSQAVQAADFLAGFQHLLQRIDDLFPNDQNPAAFSGI